MTNTTSVDASSVEVQIVPGVPVVQEPTTVVVDATPRPRPSFVRQQSSRLVREASNTAPGRLVSQASNAVNNSPPARFVSTVSNNITEQVPFLQSRKFLYCAIAFALIFCGLLFGLPHAIKPTSAAFVTGITWPIIIVGLGLYMLGWNHCSRCFIIPAHIFITCVASPTLLLAFVTLEHERLAPRGASVADWAQYYDGGTSDLTQTFYFADGHVATDMQVMETAFDWNGEHSSYISYHMAPVFAEPECTAAPPALGAPLPPRCGVAFILIFGAGSLSGAQGCAGCAGNASAIYCKGEGRWGWPSCGYGSCDCAKAEAMHNYSLVAMDEAMARSCADAPGHRLCVTQSKHTCGGSIRGNPFDQEDSDGNPCTNDATDDKNALPRELCLRRLVPGLAERFRSSATVACGRPMYALQSERVSAEGTMRTAYVWWLVGFGLLVGVIACNFLIGYQEPPEGGD